MPGLVERAAPVGVQQRTGVLVECPCHIDEALKGGCIVWKAWQVYSSERVRKVILTSVGADPGLVRYLLILFAAVEKLLSGDSKMYGNFTRKQWPNPMKTKIGVSRIE
jgi:hypothetical protein